eukprot:SAG31_NODE_547_length_14228_cov_3.787105_14_plen_82_part_00
MLPLGGLAANMCSYLGRKTLSMSEEGKGIDATATMWSVTWQNEHGDERFAVAEREKESSGKREKFTFDKRDLVCCISRLNY